MEITKAMSEVEVPTIKRSLDLEDYSRYYSHEFSCGTCGRRDHAYVIKGRPLTGLGADCRACGCYNKFSTASPSYGCQPQGESDK
jgi:hypothetical protein